VTVIALFHWNLAICAHADGRLLVPSEGTESPAWTFPLDAAEVAKMRMSHNFDFYGKVGAPCGAPEAI
jgi:hypothetical protein